MRMRAVLALAITALLPLTLQAHGVARGDARFLQSLTGPAILPLMYLGAKHMVTGYDHLLFLVGVIFFLYRLRDVVEYVSLFTVGHSVTLLAGVLGGIHANPYIVDAIIGFSVVYKAFDNMDGFRRVFGFQPNTRAAVLVFGLCHGFGLATKLQEFSLPKNGLVTNIISFNVGVEIGQVLALTAILIPLAYWRARPGFLAHAFTTNVLLMAGGVLLIGSQMSGYVASVQAAPSVSTRDRAQAPAAVYRTDSRSLPLRAGRGFEYKYRLPEGAGMVFTWKASGPVNYEFHGEPEDPTQKVESYEKSTGDSAAGTFTARFAGVHGWFWENTAGRDITITITSAGFYTESVELRPKFDEAKRKDVVERIPHELPEAAPPR